MKIGEFARHCGVTAKAVRYYEQIGLVHPSRADNGYRVYNDSHVQIVKEVRNLAASGISARGARPFVECLELGHEHGDDCVSSLAAYRDRIAELDRTIASLSNYRTLLASRLQERASRGFKENEMTDYTQLPDGLPVPEDDGGADHLPGTKLPDVTLRKSSGGELNLALLGSGTSVIYLYPLTGQPGKDLPDGWDDIPGARGCSTEACNFRDHFDELHEAGADHVFGLSSQSPEYQAEVVARLNLPFNMLSDEKLELADALRLPTFSAPGHSRLYARLTLIVIDSVIRHAFYPIFPPNTHAQEVLEWMHQHRKA